MTTLYTTALIEPGRAIITIDMPYLADVSVNHAYNRGSARYGVKGHVSDWLFVLRAATMKLTDAIGGQIVRPVFDLEVIAPKQRGRLPDTSNFRKLPQDALAEAMGVDDVIFGGTDIPARRVNEGEEPCIKITLEWMTQ